MKHVETITISVEGLHCSSCILMIEGELEDLEGVNQANGNYAQSTIRISYDPSLVEQQTLRETIQRLGYEIGK
ncbi:heavy-metal-associated domain-containing protein [candidate division WWE3 bacterium]|nr:heavy-metal-associated domain-containing protein [candidate division WWE3 bacterium]